MTSIKRWRRIVFDAELDCLGSSLAGNLGSDSEPKVDAGSDSTRGDHVVVSNDPGLLVGRPNKRQQIGKGPMGRRPSSFEDSSDTQDERTRANRRDVLCSTRLSADELNGFAIAQSLDHRVASAGNTEQVEGRTVRKGG